MSYETEYRIRYTIPSIQHQVEVGTIRAAEDITNEDPATPGHADRMNYAEWVINNSPVAHVFYMWPVAENPTIQAAVEASPDGSTVADTDVQFVINSNVSRAIATFMSGPYSYRPPVA